MNILYIAYSCSPLYGSEDKIGWNVPIESAKANKVYVITKEEHRQDIEQYLVDHQIDNIKFYFVDIPGIYKKWFRGSIYSGRLNIWHRRAFPIADQICKQEQIDIIHQITPVEFRSVGDYGKISNVKFVCGPLGGGEVVPRGLKSYVKSHKMAETVRAITNTWCRFKFKLSRKLYRCDEVLYANRETKSYLGSLMPSLNKRRVATEIAIDRSDLTELTNLKLKHGEKHKCRFLVAGRIIYRKGHEFLLDAMKRIPEEFDYECRILGDGPELKKLKAKCADNMLFKRVTFMGKLPYIEMAREYENADVFIMPSLRETTGSVLLEAMAKALPIVTIDQFGGTVLLDENASWLYKGSTKEEYIENLKAALVECITQPNEVLRRGKNARLYAEQYTWNEKVKYYQDIYCALLKK